MKRPGNALLVAVAVVLMAAALVVTLVPVTTCEECVAIRAIHFVKMNRQDAPAGMPERHPKSGPCPICPTCRTCGGRGKITLLKAWLNPPHEAE